MYQFANNTWRRKPFDI